MSNKNKNQNQSRTAPAQAADAATNEVQAHDATAEQVTDQTEQEAGGEMTMDEAALEEANRIADEQAKADEELAAKLKAADAAAAQPVEAGKVRMKGANCGVDGVSYVANADGFVDVDEAHAGVLERDHGFQRV